MGTGPAKLSASWTKYKVNYNCQGEEKFESGLSECNLGMYSLKVSVSNLRYLDWVLHALIKNYVVINFRLGKRIHL